VGGTVPQRALALDGLCPSLSREATPIRWASDAHLPPRELSGHARMGKAWPPAGTAVSYTRMVRGRGQRLIRRRL